ncbi:MAG: OmpA family protein [Geminicoccaceae bacterium]
MVDSLDNLASSEQLRRLLLREEQERIDRLEARLGDDDALKGSLSPIIADVLRDAGVKDYRRLADALAPIVLQSIKTEIHNSRDMMVDALYPITGRLVAAAVRNAFKDLVDQLNSRLDSTLSIDRWRAKVKATLSGRSEAEILLSEGAAFEIVDLLLIDRQSGLLIAQAVADDDQGGASSHLLSSILTAIMAFVRDAMSQSSEQDLRTLHVGDMRLHLQISPGAILAIKTKGPPPAGFETALNETFYAFLSNWGQALSEPGQMEDHDKRALTEDLEERFKFLLAAKQTNFKKPSKKGTWLLAAIAMIAVLWLGWTALLGWRIDRIETTARSVITEQSDLKGFPLDARYRSTSNTLFVSGLVPDQQSETVLRSRLETALPDTALSIDVGRLPNQLLDPGDLPTKADLAERQDALRNEVAEMLNGRMAAMSETLTSIEQHLPTTDEVMHARLSLWLDQQSIRFGRGQEVVDESDADSVLQEIADRLLSSPATIGLRIVGYSDDLGEEIASMRVSRLRAALVASKLRAFGMPSSRLEVLGRGSEKRIGNFDGTGSVNRRVEFELTYLIDEEAPTHPSRERNDGAR